MRFRPDLILKSVVGVYLVAVLMFITMAVYAHIQTVNSPMFVTKERMKEILLEGQSKGLGLGVIVGNMRNKGYMLEGYPGQPNLLSRVGGSFVLPVFVATENPIIALILCFLSFCGFTAYEQKKNRK